MTWTEANQRYLLDALADVRAFLERHIARVGKTTHSALSAEGIGAANPAPEKNAAVDPRRPPARFPADDLGPPALETICKMFGLSGFERDVLLLCAGTELDAAFPSLCAAAQGEPTRPYATFSLALAALPEPHWSAFLPAAPLRRWRLIEVGGGGVFIQSPLRIDERVLHYLAGVQHLDERLAGLVEPVEPAAELVPSHRFAAQRVAAAWSNMATGTLPAIQLCGDERVDRTAVASAACRTLGLRLHAISAHAIPTAPGELHGLMRLWEREAALSGSALLLDCDEIEPTELARERAIEQLIEHTSGALITMGRNRRCARRRLMITFDVHRPLVEEQRRIWQEILGTASPLLNGSIDPLLSQFSLSAQGMHAAASQALADLGRSGGPPMTSPQRLKEVLWDACRIEARPRLGDLAQRIDATASWDDLVLPEPQRMLLREIAAHVRQRGRVYDTWGFASKGARGLGISALFAGASGTGKTMAAEVLAGELRLDLYRIDLSQVVSKYIGETEKNLRRVFDAAEAGGAILLFDEADALFGKRSEVKDSHDRYANIEISYLLQRMEAYRGLAILTTNRKDALDSAFLRRIRFIVQFPFPDPAQRTEIWRRIFPADTPTDRLDIARLARLNVAGGNIRNIALGAAFLAADAGEPVCMSHLLRAARSEYAKLEKPLTEVEIGGWV